MLAELNERRATELDEELRALVESLMIHQEELRQQQAATEAAQRELEVSRDRYAALFDLAPVAYLCLDASGCLQDVNLTGARLLGAEREQLRGRPFRLHVVPGDRDRFAEHVARCRREERARTELALQLRGREVPVELTSRSFATPLDGPIFYTALVDLTERKRSEEERYRAEQERQRVLRESEASRAANEAKDRFLAVLSHELRTPLTPILFGLATIELQPGLPDSLRATLDMMRRNVELEARLIDDLLDVTRIARGKLRLERTTLDLHAVLGEVAEAFRSELEADGKDLVLELDAQRRHVSADPARLHQIFRNLVGNAIRFSPRGGSISVCTRDRDGGRVGASISDSGPGLPAEHRERLFQPFEQAVDDPRHAGLGLGLAISKALVEQHGGRIEAGDAQAGGARFDVELPCVEPPSGDAVAESAAGSPAQRAPAATARARTVLLVEDHCDTAEALAMSLRLRGYEVWVANGVAQALDAPLDAVDVLVSDLRLADGTGFDVIAALRARRPIPGVAMSGYGSESDRRRTRDAGFDAHLVKPVSIAALIAAIETATTS
ncbi:MAG: hybrid sensor histidine kinase/response regulator [Proteobacteria bacterium]|nr:MAG: hybrid sensor histidine kinase/response regulator [Pseudomonadota bacterium]